MGGFLVGVVEHDFNTALEAIDQSLALSPSSAPAYGFSAIIRERLAMLAEALQRTGLPG